MGLVYGGAGPPQCVHALNSQRPENSLSEFIMLGQTFSGKYYIRFEFYEVRTNVLDKYLGFRNHLVKEEEESSG